MKTDVWDETMVEQKVTYTLQVDGKFIIIENVPARVCLETGERFFSPATVERLQQTVWEKKSPAASLRRLCLSLMRSTINPQTAQDLNK